MPVPTNHPTNTVLIFTVVMTSNVTLFMSAIYKDKMHLTAVSTSYTCPQSPRGKNNATYQCQRLETAAALPTPHALQHTPV
jgi:hypothetical protein